MYFHDKRLQYPVRVTEPDPQFARLLQQAIGGVEGEIRVCFQYFFQAWGNRAPTTKYRDMLLHTATEEIGHIEMLATAVALNLDKAPVELQEEGARDGIVGAIMGGGNARQEVEGIIHKNFLSAGLAAMPVDSDGVPFDMSHIYSSGNTAADMYANVAAEATGRVLATRIYNAAHDQGMKDFLGFLIGRDTMHQQQWLAVLEELDAINGDGLPMPNSFPQSAENNEWHYTFVTTSIDGTYPEGRFTQGPSIDGKGQFEPRQMEGEGGAFALGPARPDSGAQAEQVSAAKTL